MAKFTQKRGSCRRGSEPRLPALPLGLLLAPEPTVVSLRPTPLSPPLSWAQTAASLPALWLAYGLADSRPQCFPELLASLK